MNNDDRTRSTKKPPMEEISSSGGTQHTRDLRGDSTMQSEQAEDSSSYSPMRVAAMRPVHHEFKIAGEETGGAMRQKTQPPNLGEKESLKQPFDQDAGNRGPKEPQHRDQNFQPLQTQSNIEQLGPTRPSADTLQSRSYHGLTPSFFRRQASEQQRTQLEQSNRNQAAPSEMSAGNMFGEGQWKSSGLQPSSIATEPTQPSSIAAGSMQPGFIAIAPVQSSSIATEPTQSSSIAPGSTQPSSIATGPMQPSFIAAGPTQPSFVATGPIQPSSIAAGPTQSSSIATGPMQPSSIAAGPTQSSSIATGPMQPSSIATGPAQQQFASMPSRSPPSHAASTSIHQSAVAPAHHLAPEHGSLPAGNVGPIRHTGINKSSVDAKPAGSELRTDPLHRTQATPARHAPSSASASDRHKDMHTETINQPPMPLYQSPSVKPASGHHTATHIETIHEPYHGIASSTQALEQPGSAMPDSAPAPTHQTPHSAQKPSLALGKSHDGPIPQAHTQQQPLDSQHSDDKGLSAASYPTFSRPPQQHELHPTGQDVHAASSATKPPKKLSKRERKAAKKREASKDQGILESISTALVGRRKNDVTTPEMRLNEIFEPDEQQDLTEQHRAADKHRETEERRGTEEYWRPEEYRGADEHRTADKHRAADEHRGTDEHRAADRHRATDEQRAGDEYRAADVVHAGIEGIRSMLGHIHMPKIIPHQSLGTSPVHGGEASRTGTTSSYGSSTAGQHQRKHVPSTACGLKKPKINLLLYPEEQPDYFHDVTPKHQNPDRPKSVMRAIEVPYHKHETHHAHDSTAVGHGAHEPSLARMILDMQAYGDGDTAREIESQPAHGTAPTATNLHQQGGSDEHGGTRPQMRHVPGPLVLDLHTHGDRDQPGKIESQSTYDSATAPTRRTKLHLSKAVALKKPKVNLSLFPEEEADYPRGDIDHYSNQPDHPDHPSVATEIPLSISTATPGRLEEMSPRTASQDSAGKAESDSTHTALPAHASHLEKPHSVAAALKKPKANLSLFEEEQADYPRGDVGRHSNQPDHPDHPSVAIEAPSTTATTAPGHLDEMPSNAARLGSTGEVESELSHATLASRISRLKKSDSTAAALKKPKADLSLFEEEQADYPRGELDHQPNLPACPTHPTEVIDVQLDSAHRHPHHDLHPTISETAAAAVSQGLGGIKSLLGGIHMPSAMHNNNPATAAVMSGMRTAAMHHVPSAPEVDHQQSSHRGQHEHQRSMGSQSPTQIPYGPPNAPESHEVNPHAYKELELDLSLDTPRGESLERHREHHAAPAGAASGTPSKAPSTSEHYVGPTASQVHSAPPNVASEEPSAMQRQRNRKFVPSEHHDRHMEIHGLLEDIDTGEYFASEDETQSPSLSGSISLSIMRALGFGADSKQDRHQQTLKPETDPTKILSRKSEPTSVLPPASRTFYTTPGIHDHILTEDDHVSYTAPMNVEMCEEGPLKILERKSEPVSVRSPVPTSHSVFPLASSDSPTATESQETKSFDVHERSSEPVSVMPPSYSPPPKSSIPGHYPETKDGKKEATSHTGPKMESHGVEPPQKQQSPRQTSHHQTPTTKIPIAQPPVQTSSASIPVTKTSITVAPVAPVWEAPATSTIRAAAPLMAAAAMHVNPDEVESWKTTETESTQNLDQQKDHHHHDVSKTAPLIPPPNLSQHKDDHDHDASAHTHPTGSSAIHTAVPMMAAAATSVKPDEVQVMEGPEPTPAQSLRQGKFKEQQHHELPARKEAPGSSTTTTGMTTSAGQSQHMHTPSAPTMDRGDQAKMTESLPISGARHGVNVMPPIADTGAPDQWDSQTKSESVDSRLDDKDMHKDRDVSMPSRHNEHYEKSHQQYQQPSSAQAYSTEHQMKPEQHQNTETLHHRQPLQSQQPQQQPSQKLQYQQDQQPNEQREQQQRQEEYLRQLQHQQANTGYGAFKGGRYHGL